LQQSPALLVFLSEQALADEAFVALLHRVLDVVDEQPHSETFLLPLRFDTTSQMLPRLKQWRQKPIELIDEDDIANRLMPALQGRLSDINMLGQEVAGYKLTELLGQGGMGRVFKAEHPSGNKRAIKILRDSVSQDQHFQERLRTEATKAGRLDHAGIVKIHEWGFNQHVSRFYLVMDWMKDGSLAHLYDRRQRTGKRPLPLATWLDMMEQAVRALAVAHGEGLIHRDIKPENMLLERHGNSYKLKLADFGLARQDGAPPIVSGSSVIVGTPSYMAPEQCQGQTVTPQSDIYALGIVLYELTTTRLPFMHKTNPVDIMQQHINQEPRLPRALNPELPPAIEDIILRCMAKKPEHRFDSASELASRLTNVLKQPVLQHIKPSPRSPGTQIAPELQHHVIVEIDAAFQQYLLIPGETVEIPIHVRNRGTKERTVTLTIDGIPAEWITWQEQPDQASPAETLTEQVSSPVPDASEEVPEPQPDKIALLPIDQATRICHVTLPQAPSSTAKIYQVTFAAISDDNQPCLAATGEWTVAPFANSHLEIKPEVAQGKERGIYLINISNGGNARLRYQFEFLQQEKAKSGKSPLHPLFQRQVLEVEAGQTAKMEMSVQPAKEIKQPWFNSQRFAFEITTTPAIASADGEDAPSYCLLDNPCTAHATFDYLPRIPRPVLFTLLQPLLILLFLMLWAVTVNPENPAGALAQVPTLEATDRPTLPATATPTDTPTDTPSPTITPGITQTAMSPEETQGTPTDNPDNTDTPTTSTPTTTPTSTPDNTATSVALTAQAVNAASQTSAALTAQAVNATSQSQTQTSAALTAQAQAQINATATAQDAATAKAIQAVKETNTAQAQVVTVPGVVGSDSGSAEQAIRDARLVPNTTFGGSNCNPFYVVSQNPPGGSSATLGSIVTIQVCPQVIVPNVIDMDKNEASGVLSNAGLGVSLVSNCDGTKPDGQVWATEPGPDSSVSPGTTVTVYHYKGCSDEPGGGNGNGPSVQPTP
jgi:serine/threonine protein kinase